ncbi:MAG: sigma-70 family RNA polymerase sigma factor [Acidimicrobiales bacterium]|nr:sigma-70 family RNA polymerase sigma factor [Acidimicrobiales bacterium]
MALYDRLVRVTYGVCWDRPLAEECAQEALVAAWERLERGEQLRSIEAWTVRVSLNRCRSRLRRVGSERRALDRLAAQRGGPGAAEPTTTGTGLAADVEAAVRDLPLRQREAVVLHYLCDMEVARVAEATGRSTGAVKNALFHARATLARRLGADAVEEVPRG